MVIFSPFHTLIRATFYPVFKERATSTARIPSHGFVAWVSRQSINTQPQQSTYLLANGRL